MALEKITTKTLRQRVYEQLRTKVLQAEILPGETISLRGLADKFGVSLLPVREAVWQLESEKILVVESNKKIQVNKLSAKEFKEILRLRLVLESIAIERASQKRPDDAVPKVYQILKGMENTIGKRTKTYLRKNTEFHFEIYSYAESPLLIETIERLVSRVHPYVYLYAVYERDLSYAMQCHSKIFEGFAEGDEIKSVAALRRDIEDAARVIIPCLE